MNVSEDTVTQGELAEWFDMKSQLKKLKDKEILMRKKISTHFFPDPKEGTNRHNLGDGYDLVLNHSLNRSIDEGALNALASQLAEASVSVDAMVRTKPSLNKRAYNTLTEEQRQLFDQALVIKDGSPTLSIVKCKKGG